MYIPTAGLITEADWDLYLLDRFYFIVGLSVIQKKLGMTLKIC